jgi:O-antigen ligase
MSIKVLPLMVKIELVLAISLVMALPLVSSDYFFAAFVLPKRLIFSSILILLVFSWFSRSWLSGRLIWPVNRAYNMFLASFALVGLWGILIAPYGFEALMGQPLRSFGFAVQLGLVVFFAWLVANRKLVHDNLKYLYLANGTVVLAVSSFAFAQVGWLFFVAPPHGQALVRAIGLSGQPNYLASFLLGGLAINSAALLASRFWLGRLFYFASLLSGLLALLATLSRAAWLGLIITALALTLFYIFRHLRSSIRNGVLVIILAILAGSYGFLQSSYLADLADSSEIAKRLAGLTDDSALGLRSYYYNAAWSLIKKQPFGYGQDSLGYFFYPYYTPDWAALELINQSTDKAHNFFLDIWLENGLFGFAWWLLFIFWLGWIFATRQAGVQGWLFFGGASAIFISWQFGFMTLEPAFWFWLLLGLWLPSQDFKYKEYGLSAPAIVGYILVSGFLLFDFFLLLGSARVSHAYSEVLHFSALNQKTMLERLVGLSEQARDDELKAFYAAPSYALLDSAISSQDIDRKGLESVLNRLDGLQEGINNFDYQLNRLVFMTSLAANSLASKQAGSLLKDLDHQFALLAAEASGYATVQFNWGNLFFYAGDCPRAQEHYQKALALYPDMADKRMNEEHRLLVLKERANVLYYQKACRQSLKK